jgi:hypothetical protein
LYIGVIFVYGVPPYHSYRINMATKPLRTAGKKKAPAAMETTSSIDDKVKAFLEAGGEIEQVRSGVSGQANMPPPKPKPKPTETKDSN